MTADNPTYVKLHDAALTALVNWMNKGEDGPEWGRAYCDSGATAVLDAIWPEIEQYVPAAYVKPRCSWYCILRHVHLRNINDGVEAWHTHTTYKDLHEYLHMTHEDYKRWVEQKLTAEELERYGYFDE